jgi:HAE1 family hydrophobic/amphiphilic exporter-1
VWATTSALLLAGAVALLRLPLATRPTIELPRLTVSISWPGASAELVETYLGAPIEQAIQGVRGVKRIESESGEGQVSLDVELEAGTNVQLARLGILERLELLRQDFPPGAGGLAVSNYVPEGLDEEPLLLYTVFGPYTAGALQELVSRQVEPRINAVAGVAGVQAMGGALVGVAVSYSPDRLRQMGINPDAIQQALQGARAVQALGVERAGAAERRVVLRDVPAVLEDLAALPVSGIGSRVYRLDAVASVRREEDDQDRFFRINGEPAVLMRVARLPGADAIRTAALVRAAVGALTSRLPPGVRFRVVSDESERLGRQLDDLIRRGAIATGLVLVVLMLALRSWRAAGLVLGSATVAVAGTALGLYLLEIPANLLTLAGLGMGIGILVQNGVVVVQRLATVPDTAEGRARASRGIAPAVLGSTLTTVVVLFPFLYLQGDARAAFAPFAAAFAMGLGWSVLGSVLLVPALGQGHGLGRNRWPLLRRGYLRMLLLLLRWRWATIGLTIVTLAGLGWVFVKKVPRSSFGSWFGQRTTLSASLGFPRGSDPESLDRSIRELERLVVGRPGVELVQAQGFRDNAYLTVTFEDRYAMGPLPFELQEELTQRAVLIGGASVSVQGRGPGFFNGAGTAGLANFRLKILGYSFAGVERLARDLKARLERVPRVRNVEINAAGFWSGSDRASDVTLEPNRAALASYRLDARSFADAVTRELGGAAGNRRFTLGDEDLWLSVKAAGARDRSLDQLREALVPNPGAAPVRIGDLAQVSERDALARISREDQQYVRILSYEFRGPQKLADRTHKAFMRSITVPPGYSVSDEYFGWEDDQSGKGLWLVFAVGLVLVVLAVAMVFNSAWASVMVFLSLPIALGGVVAAFWWSGAAFTREAAVGVILVVGLAVHQVILLVHGVLARRPPGMGRRRSARDIALAARDRAGMILLVTLTTLASLLPLAIGADTDAMFGAIALATAGGTVAGTIGALFLVPPMLAGRRRRKVS